MAFKELMESETTVLDIDMYRIRELNGDVACYIALIGEDNLRLGDIITLEGTLFNKHYNVSHRVIYTNIPKGEEIKQKLDELYPDDDTYAESINRVCEELGIETINPVVGDLLTYFGTLPCGISHRLLAVKQFKKTGIISSCPEALLQTPVVAGIHTSDIDKSFNKIHGLGLRSPEEKEARCRLADISKEWSLRIHEVCDKIYNHICK